MKQHEFFKQTKTKDKKEKDIKPLEFAKDAIVLAAGVAILGAGLSLLD